MTTIEINHPSGEWVEVYRGDDEEIVRAMAERYALDMGLRVRITRPVFIPAPERKES